MDDKALYLFIKCRLLESKTSETKCAEMINVNQQNFNRRLRAGTLRALELVNLLNAMGYRVYAERAGEKVEIK